MVALTSRLVVCLALICVGAGSASAACTQQQAVDKMMVVVQGLEKLQTENAINNDRLLSANEKLNEAGGALANGDNDGACRVYDQIAADNGIVMP